MSGVPLLVAAEIRSLVDASALNGLEVTWLAAAQPIPPGPFRGLVSLLTRRIDRAVLERLPDLRIVANVAVGYDNVDLEAAAQRGVIVTNTPEVLTDATAELTWALILAAARGLAEAEQVVRRGAWGGWHPAEFLGVELAGGTLGIVGAGRIGQAVGRRGVAFGMRVVYTARSRKPDFERATGAERLELNALLERSDVVTLHLPARPETEGIISSERLARMRAGAVLVNTARGDLIDERALADALASGHLRAAALDVFRGEPHPSAALARAPHLVLTPHIGSATERTRRRMAACALANAQAVLRGEAPLTPVVR